MTDLFEFIVLGRNRLTQFWKEPKDRPSMNLQSSRNFLHWQWWTLMAKEESGSAE
ncbi:MAG: hypothetical protein KME42_07775 [Tildeniella nuda ZEHNDER 1965/U140]|nr:hypothetical protein [Tildeniella nuda ZEHNDER 1965/U140]